MGGAIYGARGSSLYFMTGTRDVTTFADVVYGKISELHLSQISLVSLKMISRMPVSGCALLENGISYRDSNFTVA